MRRSTGILSRFAGFTKHLCFVFREKVAGCRHNPHAGIVRYALPSADNSTKVCQREDPVILCRKVIGDSSLRLRSGKGLAENRRIAVKRKSAGPDDIHVQELAPMPL
jgi:hypothetical protein